MIRPVFFKLRPKRGGTEKLIEKMFNNGAVKSIFFVEIK